MMKVDTEGFSALAVEAREGFVLVGLSDCTVAIIDLTREVSGLKLLLYAAFSY
jgi:hypothetical protein